MPSLLARMLLKSYPLSRFKSKRWPAVSLSISYLYQQISSPQSMQIKVKIKFHHNSDVPQFNTHFFNIIPKLFSFLLQQSKMIFLQPERFRIQISNSKVSFGLLEKPRKIKSTRHDSKQQSSVQLFLFKRSEAMTSHHSLSCGDRLNNSVI